MRIAIRLCLIIALFVGSASLSQNVARTGKEAYSGTPERTPNNFRFRPYGFRTVIYGGMSYAQFRLAIPPRDIDPANNDSLTVLEAKEYRHTFNVEPDVSVLEVHNTWGDTIEVFFSHKSLPWKSDNSTDYDFSSFFVSDSLFKIVFSHGGGMRLTQEFKEWSDRFFGALTNPGAFKSYSKHYKKFEEGDQDGVLYSSSEEREIWVYPWFLYMKEKTISLGGPVANADGTTTQSIIFLPRLR